LQARPASHLRKALNSNLLRDMRRKPDIASPRMPRRYAWLPYLIIGMTVFALAVGFLALRAIERRVVATVGETLALAAADIADKLDRILAERYNDIQIMAQTPVLRGRDREAMTEYLKAMQKVTPIYVWLAVTDANGRVTAATEKASIGQDRSGRAWFQAVRDGVPVHVRDAALSEDAGGITTVSFTAPIKGATGEFLGAVTSRVELQSLEDVFARTIYALEVQRGASSKVEWQFLTHDGEVIVDSVLRQEGNLNLKQRRLPSALLLEGGQPGYVAEEHLRRHVPVVTGYARTGGYGRFTGLQWGVLVRMDRSVILAPFREILWKLGIAGIVVWAPMFGLLVWSTKRLQKEWALAQQESELARAAEALVLEREEHSRKIFDDAPIGMALVGLDYRFVKVNRVLCTMLGYDERELTAKTFADITHPDDLKEDLDLAAQVFKGDLPSYSLEKRYLKKDGEIVWIYLTATVIRNQGGTILHGLAMMKDITERKRAEKELRESQQRFQLINDNANDAIFYLDLNGKIQWANRQASAVTGRPMTELVRRSFMDLLTPSSATVAETRLDAVRRGQSVPSVVEFELLRQDDSKVWIEANITSVKEHGETVGRLVVARDHTERKRIEQRLRQSEKLAALGTLLDGVAHELNNPLFMIDGFAQLAGEKLRQERYQDLTGDLASIHEASQRAKEIVQRTLTVARHQKGGSRACDISALLKETLDVVANDLVIHSIELHTALQADLPPVLADPQDLMQLFLNLITNARQAMVTTRGRGMLKVSSALVSDRQMPYVEARITDDGPGIPRQHHSRVFEPFFTTKPVGEGTGLGLSICHRIVSELRGTVNLESADGQGATFIVRLPVMASP
jgi:two-component system cell cycle sensor histidine kinase/response regulator CckA